MKRNNKKGFTIVELVIVIAVIAILSAVLIPTFGGITEKANNSAAQQLARNKYTECYALDISDGVVDGKENGVDIADANYVVEAGVGTYYAVNKNGGFTTFDGTEFDNADALPTVTPPANEESGTEGGEQGGTV